MDFSHLPYVTRTFFILLRMWWRRTRATKTTTFTLIDRDAFGEKVRYCLISKSQFVTIDLTCNRTIYGEHSFLWKVQRAGGGQVNIPFMDVNFLRREVYSKTTRRFTLSLPCYIFTHFLHGISRIFDVAMRFSYACKLPSFRDEEFVFVHLGWGRCGLG